MATLELYSHSELTNYKFQTNLDGAVFDLQLFWNNRSQSWFLSLYDAQGAAIFEGKKVVAGASFLDRIQNDDAPAGTLLAFDTTGAGHKPGLQELGRRVKLFYVEAS